MPGLEYYLKKYATYEPGRIKEAPVSKLLRRYELQPLSKGLQARVYRIKGQGWVVKEGRWDLELTLQQGITLPLPAAFVQRILGVFSYTFQPTAEEISRQYREYLLFLQYFGYFSEYPRRFWNRFIHPRLREFTRKQEQLRQALPEYITMIESRYGFEIPHGNRKILESPLRFHNFLPQEYLLVGQSLQEKYSHKLTSYVFQRFVEGELLHDVPNDELSVMAQQQLVLLAFLILLMHEREGMVPDTRPRHILSQSGDWLTETDNIIVSSDGLKFIDTNWFWRTNDNFVKRGLFIPDTILSLSKSLLQKPAGVSEEFVDLTGG